MNNYSKNFKLSAVLLFGVLSWSFMLHAQQGEQGAATPPEGMPFRHALGYELFQDNCAQCHGTDLEGTDEGPPLMHSIYNPGHHSDAAFFRAIEQGSPQHHWNFGDMKPVEGVDKQKAGAIIEFVRWYQQESGLY
jgi:mono/diheme cytochrome c family protein